MKVGNKENKYQLGDKVFLRTDIKQFARMITGIRFISGGSILYDIVIDTESSCHHESELSSERDVILATSND